MKRIIYLLMMVIFMGLQSSAQPIFIDQPIEAGDLIVFPHITDSTKFYYLPNKIALGTTLSGQPQFSFLRYVQNVKTAAGEVSQNEGDGGGIVHALVELKVTDAQLAQAQAALKKKLKRDNAVITGPVIYKGGTFALVSSFAEEGSDFTRKVIGVGRAPVFVGNKAAVSMRLTKLGAKILWESCQTPTPDLSFSFVMDFSGYRSPMQARVEVDWDKVFEHEGFSAGVSVGYKMISAGADIKKSYDELREQGAIKVINLGADDKMEAMIDVAYKKMLDMMFAPFSMPKAYDESTMDKVAKGISAVAQGITQGATKGGSEGSSGGGGAFGLSFNFSYEMKTQRRTGKYVIDLSKASMESINFRFDENLGSDVAECKDCFRSVNLDDPFYKQREILVSVDGLNSEQFSKYINFVTVSMKKIHGGGELTTDEVRIAQKEFTEAAGNPFRLLYGWKDAKDSERNAWLRYQYKTVWSFFGGHSVTYDWAETDDLGLNVAPPFHPMAVSVEADPSLLKDAGIRVVTVKFYYDYGAGEQVEQVTLKGTDEVPAQLAEFMLRQGNYNYDYEIVWRLFGNKTLTSGRKRSSDTLLYVDEIPQEATSVTN